MRASHTARAVVGVASSAGAAKAAWVGPQVLLLVARPTQTGLTVMQGLGLSLPVVTVAKVVAVLQAVLLRLAAVAVAVLTLQELTQ